MTAERGIRRWLCRIVVAALIAVCPGLDAYQAAAAELESPVPSAPLTPQLPATSLPEMPGIDAPLQGVPELGPGQVPAAEVPSALVEQTPAAISAPLASAAAKAAAPSRVESRFRAKAAAIGRRFVQLGRFFQPPGSEAGNSFTAPVLPPVPSADHLVYDLQHESFRRGYLAAMAWRPGDALTVPPDSKRRAQFLAGAAYRVAEVQKDEAKGKDFLAKASADPRGAAALLNASLAAAPAAPSLRGSTNSDFAQGYLTAAAWRPAKQVWLPASSWRERLNPLLRRKMTARDRNFVEGLLAGLREAHGEKTEQALRAELEGGPAVGTKELADKLPYSLANVLEASYDKALDEKLPFIPGKVRIPRSALGLLLGNLLVIFGINLHINSQAYLVYGLTGSKAMIGVVRNVHYAAYTTSNFLPVGPAIGRTDYRSMISWTGVGRVLLMGLIPMLYFSGHLPIAMLVGIIALNPYFQSTMNTAIISANASILGRDENVVREVTAISTKISAAAGLVMPLLAAYAVSHLVILFGEPGGYAAAYGIYSAMVALMIPVVRWMVRDPRYYDPSIKDKPVARALGAFEPLWAAVTAPVRAARWLWTRVKTRKPSAAPEAARPPPAPLPEGWLASRVEKAARFFDRFEGTQGLSVILRSKTLSILLGVDAIEMFLGDALDFIVIPNYIIDVLHPMASLAHLPVIGAMLSTKVGILGLLFQVSAVARFLGSRWISGPKGAERLKRLGHKPLYWGGAIGTLLFWSMMLPIAMMPMGVQAAVGLPLFFGALGIFLGREFLSSLLHTPLSIAMAPVQRNQIPNDKVGPVTQALTMIDTAITGLGSLLIGFFLDKTVISTAIPLIAVALTITAVLEWMAPIWLGKINPEGWAKGEKKPKP